MKRIAPILAAIALGLGLVFVAPAAQAEEPWPTMRLTSNTVCVLPDFPVTGSGWRIHKAVANWNAAQPYVQMTTTVTPGCSEVAVHRYTLAGDDRCAYVDYTRHWAEATTTVDGVTLYPAADLFINTACGVTSRCASKVIMEHELGHALGLGHTHGDRSSVMAEHANYDCPKYRGVVGPADVAAVAGLYA